MSSVSASSEAVPSDSGPRQRFVRDLFTGELKQVPAGEGGRQVIFRGSVPKHYDPTPSHIAANYDRELRGLSLMPEEATPERIAAENEECRRHGTGARYDAYGRCLTSTRGSQNRELKRRGKINNDAGFGDYAGR